MTRMIWGAAGKVVLLAGLALLPGHASAACGDRSGPGYRGPNGKCVGWAELGRVCGSPPESRCSPENVQTGADTAAGKGQEVQNLRQAAKPKPR